MQDTARRPLTTIEEIAVAVGCIADEFEVLNAMLERIAVTLDRIAIAQGAGGPSEE